MDRNVEHFLKSLGLRCFILTLQRLASWFLFLKVHFIWQHVLSVFLSILKKKINLESNAARRSKQTKKVLNMKGVKHSFHGGLAERRVSLCMECSKFSDFQVCDSLCFLGEAAILRIYSIQYNYLVIERHS